MKEQELINDPYNIIITGVGGQGNVLASRMVGEMLSMQGFDITIGETFGASQRGGSVMSHLRISKNGEYSPQIPMGRAHMVVSLEPTEALRVLKNYGNPGVKVITNMRPVRSVSVISGEKSYPDAQKIKQWISQLSKKAWFVDTTEAATRLGNPIFGNVMLVGALAQAGNLPLDRDVFESVLRARMPENKVAVNLNAFDIGKQLIKI
jgi:indolepyruvate ferredoxin oxidoreductase, beta subunit